MATYMSLVDYEYLKRLHALTVISMLFQLACIKHLNNFLPITIAIAGIYNS